MTQNSILTPLINLWRRVRLTIYATMPKGLFSRAITMILLPLFTVQLVLLLVFYDRVWESVMWRFSSAITGDIAHVIYTIERNPQNAVLATENTANLRMAFKFKPNAPMPVGVDDGSLLSQKMNMALQEYIPHYPTAVDVSPAPDYIVVYVQMENRVMEVTVHKTRFRASSPAILFGWVLFSSVLLALVSAIFMRNQVRPIRTLAIAMERLGKGGNTTTQSQSIQPKGALEVRQAGHAFNQMRGRIERQVRQRTDMLSGISHDLRTPLTRMKLQLSMMPQSQPTQDLLGDITEMENMINAYLDFAKGEGNETLAQTNFSTLIADICQNWQRQGKLVSSAVMPDVITSLKPNAMKRCLNNLIGNGCKFAEQVQVTLTVEQDTIVIHVDDNGTGIPESERETIFRPFKRLDDSRNPNTGGIGLGLSIAQDIIHAHGGDITLNESPMQGLRVTITLPV